MKNTSIIFFLLFSMNLFCQGLPKDSLILKSIFGKTDIGGTTFSRAFDTERGEGINTYEDNIVWKVVFKQAIKLQNQQMIFAILEAKDNTQHGHQFGYRNHYFFKTENNSIKLIDSIVDTDENVLGDNSFYEIKDIGKDKKVLVIQFQSSANHHLETSYSLMLLEKGRLTHLLSTESYDNTAWNLPESEDEDCNAIHFEESYEIIKSNKVWYDIKITRNEYAFTKACKEEFIQSETYKICRFIDGKYLE